MSSIVNYNELSEVKQITINSLFDSIKEDKRKLKKSSIERTLLSASIKDLFRTLEIDNYKRKIVAYKKLLEECQRKQIWDIYDFNVPEKDVNGKSVNHYYDEFLLKQVLEILQELVIEHNENFVVKLNDFENILSTRGLDCSPPRFWNEYLCAILSAYPERDLNVSDHLKELRKLVRYYLKRKYKKLGRDIRQCYRDIVRFKFKNMDDQSGDDNNLLFQNFLMQFIITLNKKNHGIQYNYRTDKRDYRVQYTNH